MRNTATATASDGVGKEQSRRELRLLSALARRCCCVAVCAAEAETGHGASDGVEECCLMVTPIRVLGVRFALKPYRSLSVRGRVGPLPPSPGRGCDPPKAQTKSPDLFSPAPGSKGVWARDSIRPSPPLSSPANHSPSLGPDPGYHPPDGDEDGHLLSLSLSLSLTLVHASASCSSSFLILVFVFAVFAVFVFAVRLVR